MFIVLEGLDGAGKSTQIKLLTRMLEQKGLNVEYLHFPRFDTPVYGDMIARFLRGEFGGTDEVNPYLVALLYAGDRAAAADMIRGWLEDGKCVIADRYVMSNIGYQCAKFADVKSKKSLKDWILNTEFVDFAIPRPDLSLFLDVPFDFTVSRLSQQRNGEDRDYLNGEKDIHESSLVLQRNVRETYLSMANEDIGMEIIDCSDEHGAMANESEIFKRISARVEKLL